MIELLSLRAEAPSAGWYYCAVKPLLILNSDFGFGLLMIYRNVLYYYVHVSNTCVIFSLCYWMGRFFAREGLKNNIETIINKRLLLLTSPIYKYTSIVAWIKNPFRRTSEHNHIMNEHNLMILRLFECRRGDPYMIANRKLYILYIYIYR